MLLTSPLLPSTLRRLQNLPQNPAIWEFVRHPAPTNLQFNGSDGRNQDLVLIGDATDHILRGFESIDQVSGDEAIVRALIKAMERPELPLKAGRPAKVVCPERKVQMYLRGVLQGLGITFDFSPHMTVVQDFLEELERATPPPARVPSKWEVHLGALIHTLWQTAPWEDLEETQIVKLDLNRFGVESLWACTLGHSALDPALLLFRSLDSLKELIKKWRELPNRPLEQFLDLDCLGIVFPDGFASGTDETPQGLIASIHPFEGFRDFVDDEESRILWVAASAYLEFMIQFSAGLADGKTPLEFTTQTLTLPGSTWGGEVTVTACTVPEITMELNVMRDETAPHLTTTFSSDCVNLAAKESNLLMGSVPRQFVDILESLEDRTIDVVSSNGGIPFVAIRTGAADAAQIAKGLEDFPGPFDMAIVDGLDHAQDHVANLLVAVEGLNPPLVLWQGPSGLPNPSSITAWNNEVNLTAGQCILLVTKGDPHKAQSSINPRDVIAWRLATFREAGFLGINSMHQGPTEIDLH